MQRNNKKALRGADSIPLTKGMPVVLLDLYGHVFTIGCLLSLAQHPPLLPYHKLEAIALRRHLARREISQTCDLNYPTSHVRTGSAMMYLRNAEAVNKQTHPLPSPNATRIILAATLSPALASQPSVRLLEY